MSNLIRTLIAATSEGDELDLRLRRDTDGDWWASVKSVCNRQVFSADESMHALAACGGTPQEALALLEQICSREGHLKALEEADL